MMKPDFSKMNYQELRAYVLAHIVSLCDHTQILILRL